MGAIQQQHVLGQELQSSGGQVFNRVHGSVRQPIYRNHTQLRSQRLRHHNDSCLYNPITPDDGHSNQGILTNNRYTQREFKLKFSALLKAYDVKYIENSKK